MFFLKKIFKLRDKAGGQTAEKPFMEHLEDLRDLIVRVVVTLMVATILCYLFRGTLLDILRRPIEQVWQKSEEAKLPPTITPIQWEQAKKAANRTAKLTPEQRTHFYAQFADEKLKYYAECAGYYRTALVIDDVEKRNFFIKNLPDIDDEKKDFVISLLMTNPSDAVNARKDMVFMSSLKPTETFMLAIKLSVFSGIIISFPFLLFFILQFVVPGLKPKERKALFPALLIGFGLFLGGVFFCYYSVLPKALDFFFEYGKDMGVQNEWRIGEYISFATQFTLIFGLSFELPVVVMTLVKIGILSYETMRNTRSYAIISIMVVAAVITPTGDALTLSMLAVPMVILYEICIWLAYFSRKKELVAEEEEREKIRAYHALLEEQGLNDDEDVYDQDHHHHHDHEDYHHDHYHDHHADDPDSEDDDDHQTPRIVPVPGRVPNDVGHNSEIHEDYNGESDDEGEEIDDGEVEPYDESEVYTEEDEADYESNHEAQVTEDVTPSTEDEEDETDFNPGASFENEYPTVEEEETDQEEDGDDQEKEDKKDSPKKD